MGISREWLAPSTSPLTHRHNKHSIFLLPLSFNHLQIKLIIHTIRPTTSRRSRSVIPVQVSLEYIIEYILTQPLVHIRIHTHTHTHICTLTLDAPTLHHNHPVASPQNGVTAAAAAAVRNSRISNQNACLSVVRWLTEWCLQHTHTHTHSHKYTCLVCIWAAYNGRVPVPNRQPAGLVQQLFRHSLMLSTIHTHPHTYTA